MMIEDNDILFLSSGDNFIEPVNTNRISEKRKEYKIGGKSISNYPNMVGGYKIGSFLGRGGFGEVRVGLHHLTEDKVALKFLRKSDILSIGAAERTTTEIQCLTTLKHQNIIKLSQHLESTHHVVLVFELMEGGDLLKFLQSQGTTASESSLSEDEARPLFHQVLSAVSFAHNQHICHRDLKLENILLKGNSLSLVKIADFGLSDFYRPGATMKSNCGTLSFLAPEVFRGTSNAGPPLDVWSLGVILFAILCGRLPFEGPDLHGTKRPRDAIIKSRIMKCQYKIEEHLGPEAKDLVRRMLKLDPTERASLPEIFNHCWMRPSANGLQYMEHSKDNIDRFENINKTKDKEDNIDFEIESPIITPRTQSDSEISEQETNTIDSEFETLSINGLQPESTQNIESFSSFNKKNEKVIAISDASPKILSSSISIESLSSPISSLPIINESGSNYIQNSPINSFLNNLLSEELINNAFNASVDSSGVKINTSSSIDDLDENLTNDDNNAATNSPVASLSTIQLVPLRRMSKQIAITENFDFEFEKNDNKYDQLEKLSIDTSDIRGNANNVIRPKTCSETSSSRSKHLRINSYDKDDDFKSKSVSKSPYGYKDTNSFSTKEDFKSTPSKNSMPKDSFGSPILNERRGSRKFAGWTSSNNLDKDKEINLVSSSLDTKKLNSIGFTTGKRENKQDLLVFTESDATSINALSPVSNRKIVKKVVDKNSKIYP
jgi:serine/threonine protein kinase